MRKIVKEYEPRELTALRTTPGAHYEPFDELTKALLEEQGYICAYCSRRIPCKDKNSSEKHRIEHIKCQARYPELELDYKNMVVCCPGAINSNSDFHCDKGKADQDISFDIFSDGFHSTLEYHSGNGTIRSTNAIWDDEINEILNLNNSRLCANRACALEALITIMGKGSWTRSKKTAQLKKYDGKDKEGKYKPYGNIVIWYLHKNLRRP